MTGDGLEQALIEVSTSLQKSTKTTNILREELHEEKHWRRWVMFLMGVTIICILLVSIFASGVLISVRDCTQPNGSCYKTAIDREDERRRNTINGSNKLVSDVLQKISSDLNAQLKELERNLTTTTIVR